MSGVPFHTRALLLVIIVCFVAFFVLGMVAFSVALTHAPTAALVVLVAAGLFGAVRRGWRQAIKEWEKNHS